MNELLHVIDFWNYDIYFKTLTESIFMIYFWLIFQKDVPLNQSSQTSDLPKIQANLRPLTSFCLRFKLMLHVRVLHFFFKKSLIKKHSLYIINPANFRAGDNSLYQHAHTPYRQHLHFDSLHQHRWTDWKTLWNHNQRVMGLPHYNVLANLWQHLKN